MPFTLFNKGFLVLKKRYIKTVYTKKLYLMLWNIPKSILKYTLCKICYEILN